ncbi:hypothetical protein L1987_32776 [Smallanthus sonchifolius]|uniref:Uncharacterized protein n=1 Tax=Smallanthus sonchifolius TaxID=185202 RepID=A0ACB9HQ16_9ASTR|nr:hypothetical protein L1987_32776 [Smallanthus sonchifolius]
MKSAGKKNLPTFTSKFSMIPIGDLTDPSASSIVSLIGHGFPIFNLLNMTYGITFKLAPISASAKVCEIGTFSLSELLEEYPPEQVVELPLTVTLGWLFLRYVDEVVLR